MSTTPERRKGPTVSISGVTVVESDGTGTVARVGLTLKRGEGTKVKVRWVTEDGSATAPADYAAAHGKVVFKGPARKKTKTIEIPVVGDDLVEKDESFLVRLARVRGAAVGQAAATVTIRDDDVVTPQATHTLTVTRSGPAGTITSSPPGISCPSACSLVAAAGAPVMLTASPGASTVAFTGWSGGCSGSATTCTVTMSADKSVTGTFVPALNYSLPPNYGTKALASGFAPDPFTTGITSGGSLDVSYLGGGCSGYTTQAPDFRVNYTSGGAPLLRFYFVGSGDTTMIVNSPSSAYACSDDSYGTLDPTVDYVSPSSGAYEIWIGSFSSGTFISGTLYVTELSGNHP